MPSLAQVTTANGVCWTVAKITRGTEVANICAGLGARSSIPHRRCTAALGEFNWPAELPTYPLAKRQSLPATLRCW